MRSARRELERAAEVARLAEERSVLDTVLENARSLQRGLGKDDNEKLNEYFQLSVNFFFAFKPTIYLCIPPFFHFQAKKNCALKSNTIADQKYLC